MDPKSEVSRDKPFQKSISVRFTPWYQNGYPIFNTDRFHATNSLGSVRQAFPASTRPGSITDCRNSESCVRHVCVCVCVCVRACVKIACDMVVEICNKYARQSSDRKN